MNDSFGSVKIMHEELGAIIASYDFDFTIKLCFNRCNEVHDYVSCLSFCMHDMYPCETRVIINYS